MTTRDNSEQAMHEAASWVLEVQGGEITVADRKRFAMWLRESPANVREYLELAGMWKELETLDADHVIDVDALLSDTNVLSLAATGTTFEEPRPAAHRKRWAYWTAASAAAIVIAIGGQSFWQNATGPIDEIVTTRLGEQRSIALEDGSVVHLNTDSSALIALDGTQRYIELQSGEAYFTVAKDPTRPFIVRAGETEVRAIGTQFNVRREAEIATVTVVEGKVAVTQTPASGPKASPTTTANGRPAVAPSSVELTSGQQARVGAAVASIQTEAVKTEKVVAWTERRLMFEGERLDAIVSEFNRYNLIRLDVVDPDIASIKLTAVFDSNDPDSLLDYLALTESVEIDRRADGTRVIRGVQRP